MIIMVCTANEFRDIAAQIISLVVRNEEAHRRANGEKWEEMWSRPFAWHEMEDSPPPG
jgi:hypothetical protein